MNTPICDFLKRYQTSEITRFHMPGHKGESPVPGLSYALDLTEIKGADSLYEASGIIAESEANASAVFGTEASFYSTEGSSQVIRGMLALAQGFYQTYHPGKRACILAARNVHRSFVTAAALLDLDVEWLFSKEDPFTLCACPITADQVEAALSTAAELPAAVYLTSPDYLGNIQDIAKISEVSHRYKVPLLVDNAHGAYFHFLDEPLHPMDLGADLCCDSAHKTLPALTGCAYLHICKSKRGQAEADVLSDFSNYCIKHAKSMLSLFGSTSPSYLQLASLDQLNPLLNEGWGQRLKNCIRRVQSCKAVLQMKGWEFSGQEPMKITIHCSPYGYSGMELADFLRSSQIECEYADPDYLVLMPSPSNTEKDFQRLESALSSVPYRERSSAVFDAWTSGSFERACSIREAVFAPKKCIPVKDAPGKICGDLAISCPPAVPIVVCGERISQEHLPVFAHYGIWQIQIAAK